MNSHRSVLEHGNTPRQISDHLGREFTFLCNASCEFAGILLDVLDVGLELSAKFLEMLNDGSVYGLGEVRMVIRDQTGAFTLGKRKFDWKISY